MLEYHYDGTGAGLLAAFEHALKNKQSPGAFIAARAAAPDLFCDAIEIPCDLRAAECFAERMSAIDRRVPGELLQVFLSEAENVEKLMFDYCRLLLDNGGGVRSDLGNAVVAKFQRLARQVGRETHRFKGLLRFEELPDRMLWANYEPVCNITMLLVPHFIRRMPHERWVICDVRRGVAVYWDGKNAAPVEVHQSVLESLRATGRLPGRRPENDHYTGLWRTFFRSVAIRERTNLKLQRQFMPKQFWKWLPEKI